jgi:hypothetical protein
LVPFDFNTGKAIRDSEGILPIAQYANYEVPWNRGIALWEWLTNFDKKELAYQKSIADDFLVALTAYFDQTIGVIHATGQYLMKNKELIELYGGVKDFKERYPIIKEAKDLTQKRVSEITGAFKTIKEVELTVLAEVITPYSPTVL